MSNDLNQCNFIGRLGRDPETRYMANGDAVCNFSLAVGWKGKDKEGTEWVRCVAFGKLGDIAGKYLVKGKQCFVSGRMSTRKWADKDGVERYSTEINVDRLQLLGSKSDGEGRQAEQRQEQRPANSGPAYDDSEEIPFADPYKGRLSYVV